LAVEEFQAAGVLSFKNAGKSIHSLNTVGQPSSRAVPVEISLASVELKASDCLPIELDAGREGFFVPLTEFLDATSVRILLSNSKNLSCI